MSTTYKNLQDILPVLAELRHAQDMQVALETHVNEGNFFKVSILFFYHINFSNYLLNVKYFKYVPLSKTAALC